MENFDIWAILEPRWKPLIHGGILTPELKLAKENNGEVSNHIQHIFFPILEAPHSKST